MPRCVCGHPVTVHALPERGDRSRRLACTAHEDGQKCPCKQYVEESNGE